MYKKLAQVISLAYLKSTYSGNNNQLTATMWDKLVALLEENINLSKDLDVQILSLHQKIDNIQMQLSEFKRITQDRFVNLEQRVSKLEKKSGPKEFHNAEI